MAKKSGRNTKSKIVSAAWKLFYDQGYDATTVEEIIFESGTSKGSFYHYFDGKDALLGTLADLFDQKYESLEPSLDVNGDCVEHVKRLYATQLTAKGEKQLLDHNRVYYRLLRKLVLAGQKSGQLTDKQTVNDIVRYYAFCERSLIYDWGLCNGEFSLKESAGRLMPFFMERIKK